MDGEIKRIRISELRELLDGNNMDSKESVARTAHLVVTNFLHCIETLLERVVIPHVDIFDGDKLSPEKMRIAEGKMSELKEFIDGIVSTMVMVEAFGACVSASAIDGYLLSNGFVNYIETFKEKSKLEVAILEQVFHSSMEIMEEVRRNGKAA